MRTVLFCDVCAFFGRKDCIRTGNSSENPSRRFGGTAVPPTLAHGHWLVARWILPPLGYVVVVLVLTALFSVCKKAIHGFTHEILVGDLSVSSPPTSVPCPARSSRALPPVRDPEVA